MKNNPINIAWSRMRRAPYQMLAAVAIMSVTLFLACAFFVIAAGSQAVLYYFEGRPQLNAYFKSDVIPTPQQIESIKSKVLSTGLIDKVKYISKEDAFDIYKNLNKQDPLLLEAVTPGMLPASIEVSTKNPNDLKAISELIKSEPGIDDIRFEEDVVVNLTRWTNSLRTIGIVFVGTHIFITFLVILLIVGLKVANRKEEISVMQLMGAGMGYIAAPFVWEGITYGIIGAIIAWGTVYLIILYSMGFLLTLLAGIPILPPPILFMFQVLGGTTLMGVIIGAIGGWLAVVELVSGGHGPRIVAWDRRVRVEGIGDLLMGVLYPRVRARGGGADLARAAGGSHGGAWLISRACARGLEARGRDGERPVRTSRSSYCDFGRSPRAVTIRDRHSRNVLVDAQSETE